MKREVQKKEPRKGSLPKVKYGSIQAIFLAEDITFMNYIYGRKLKHEVYLKQKILNKRLIKKNQVNEDKSNV